MFPRGCNISEVVKCIYLYVCHERQKCQSIIKNSDSGEVLPTFLCMLDPQNGNIVPPIFKQCYVAMENSECEQFLGSLGI